MNMYGYEFYTEHDLLHYGLKGMHWGIRRWQNEDGTFNEAGKERYFGRGSHSNYRSIKSGSQKTVGESSTRTETVAKTSNSGDRLKKIAKGAAIAGGVALAAYGAYKVSQMDPAVLVKYKQTVTSVLNTASSGAKKAYNAAASDQAKAAYKKVGDIAAKGAKTTAQGVKKAYQVATSDQAKAAYKKTGKAIVYAGKKTYAAVTSEQAKTVYKKTADIGKKAVEKVYKTATSDQAKAAYKKAGQTTAKVANTAAKKTADYVKSGQVKKDAKETTQLVGEAASTVAEIVKAIPDLTAEYKKGNLPGQQVIKSSRKAQIVRQYKQEHPNTKLSDAEIIENYEQRVNQNG